MKTTILTVSFNNLHFIFQPITGLLLCIDTIKSTNKSFLDNKIKSILLLTNNPYSLNVSNNINEFNFKNSRRVNLYAKTLTFIASFSFKLAQYFSCLIPKFFNNTSQAIAYYRKNIYPNKQNELCLARALFAAATSKSFKEKGMIFIGVFLPTENMHAWIIEDAKIVDNEDGIWLNYQPVAAIYYE